ncbi:MAG: hypothetical protein AB7V77_01370 [Candidatus Woesearchaeota archaeon]
MDEGSEYEILPHEELERLRQEVSEIKKNPLGKHYEGTDLVDAVHKLTETINHMNNIFTTTNQEMAEEFKSNSIRGSFDNISSQNEEIAKGILSVAQLVQKQTELLNDLIEKVQNQPVMNSAPTHTQPITQQNNQEQNTKSPKDLQNMKNPNENVSNEPSDENLSNMSLDFPPMDSDMPPINQPPKKTGFFSKFK